MSSKKYQKYKIEGLCRRCGLEPLPNKTRCQKCNTAHLAYQLKSKNNAIVDGRCRYCLTNKAMELKSMCSECLCKHSKKQKENYQKYRTACLIAYGGSCNCCGTTVSKYLQLDHINNDGSEHRNNLFNGGTGSIYPWAYRNNFPNMLQLLCANCHQAKTVGEVCTEEDHMQLNRCGTVYDRK